MMKPTQKLTEAQLFFFRWAGWSYAPKTQTKEQGRTEGAIALAAAEALAIELNCRFNWIVDPDCDSSEWSNDTPPWPQYVCVMHNDYEQLANLSCIDFGRNATPFTCPHYARVVEAELAIGANLSPEPDNMQHCLEHIRQGIRDLNVTSSTEDYIDTGDVWELLNDWRERIDTLLG